jgi:hypothetical protein
MLLEVVEVEPDKLEPPEPDRQEGSVEMDLHLL